MKTRAAVAWKAGAPLTIETVDLAGPRNGEAGLLRNSVCPRLPFVERDV